MVGCRDADNKAVMDNDSCEAKEGAMDGEKCDEDEAARDEV